MLLYHNRMKRSLNAWIKTAEKLSRHLPGQPKKLMLEDSEKHIQPYTRHLWSPGHTVCPLSQSWFGNDSHFQFMYICFEMQIHNSFGQDWLQISLTCTCNLLIWQGFLFLIFCSSLTHQVLLPSPGRAFRNFRAPGSGDQRILCSSETAYDGFQRLWKRRSGSYLLLLFLLPFYSYLSFLSPWPTQELNRPRSRNMSRARNTQLQAVSGCGCLLLHTCLGYYYLTLYVWWLFFFSFFFFFFALRDSGVSLSGSNFPFPQATMFVSRLDCSTISAPHSLIGFILLT